ncbi:MAG: hypothetical protein H7Y60_17795 [Rhodospirillaceae bacterium]|nr:hypothetical protein [Rhodospirillales bacterium]
MDDIFANALGVLGRVAPTIAGMIGGPFAGMAVQAIETAFGLPATGDKDAALKAVANATPEQLQALKAEDNRHAEAMEELGVRRDQLGVEDRKSSRDMQVQTRSWVPGTLAIAMTFGFFGLLGWLVSHEPPQGSRDILNIMLGALGTGWAGMLSFYFGSSKGEHEATQLLARAPAIGASN